MYKGSLSDPGEQHFSRDAGRGGAVNELTAWACAAQRRLQLETQASKIRR